MRRRRLNRGYLRLDGFSRDFRRHRFRARKSHCLSDRQTNGKHRTAALAVLRNDLAAIRLDQLSSNRQAEADTSGSSARTAIEFLEYFRFLSGFETGAAIGYGNDQHGIIAGGAHFNRSIGFAKT